MSRRVLTAEDVVRSPKLWAELAEVLLLQARLMKQISEAIQANDFETVRNSLKSLFTLVKQRQPTLERLSPAIQQLMVELFEDEG